MAPRPAVKGIPVSVPATVLADARAAVRARAAELGILRGQPPPAEESSALAAPNPPPRSSKFVVCDHCRSHGLRCNEASVCKECILRLVPCVHHACDVSPTSKAACTRTNCFYVHQDYMPDIHGMHSPADANWLVLPGKIPPCFSAGPLNSTRVQDKTPEEVMEAYQSVFDRQRHGFRLMEEVVNSGQATWDTVTMACRCVEIEAEEARTRAAEEDLRRLAITSPLFPASGAPGSSSGR